MPLSPLCKQVVKAKQSPASTALYPAAPCMHLPASGTNPLSTKQQRKRRKKNRNKINEEDEVEEDKEI